MAVIPNMPDDETVLEYRVRQLEGAVKDMKTKLDSVNARLLGLALTIAASAIVFALTVLAGTR